MTKLFEHSKGMTMKAVPTRNLKVTAALACLLMGVAAVPLRAQQPVAQETPPAAGAASEDALRKAAQNPVASLISVPIQENWNFGIQPGYRTQNVLNIQPVIPIGVTKDWNLIIRWITPVIYQPVTVPQEIGSPVQTGYSSLMELLSVSPMN